MAVSHQPRSLLYSFNILLARFAETAKDIALTGDQSLRRHIRGIL